jgi:hypothetical protein
VVDYHSQWSSDYGGYGGGVKNKRFWYIFGPFYFDHNFSSFKANSKNLDLETRLFWLPFNAQIYEHSAHLLVLGVA